MNWRGVYILAFLVYAALVAVVSLTAHMPVKLIVLFAIASALPPALLGVLVVRHFRAENGALRNVLFGAAFAVCVVFATTMILWAGIPAERFTFRFENALWGLMTDAMIFLILAAATHAQRVQSDLAKAEASRARAELAALRARIDPHFLFNTLHSLLALVRQDPSRAEEAIEQFGDILRYTFAASDGSEERTLQQEWQLVDNYLALERLRLGARLRVNENLDPEVAGVPLPVLTLQPIVENAIRHAIAPRAGGGTIDIRATRAGDRVMIDISDDGPGAPPHTLATTNGKGLHLVRERLDRMYRGSATFEARNSPQGGLQITIGLPFEDE